MLYYWVYVGCRNWTLESKMAASHMTLQRPEADKFLGIGIGWEQESWFRTITDWNLFVLFCVHELKQLFPL